MSKKKSNKGAPFERKICKRLSVWWSSGRRDDIFWRTAGSGARATQRSKQGLRTADSYGDVMSSHESGKPLTQNYVISIKRGYTNKKERKSLRKISLLDIVDVDMEAHKTKPTLLTWWEELQADIRNGRRADGFIIFRRDHRRSVIVMNNYTWKKLDEQKPCIYPYYHPGCWLQMHGLDLHIMQLNEFFYWCNPQMMGAPRLLRRDCFKSDFNWIEPGPNCKTSGDDDFDYSILQQAKRKFFT